MPKHTVLISPTHMDPSYEIERRELGPDVELRPFSATDPATLGAEARDADAVMVWRMLFPAAAIEQLRRCKVIVRFGVGYDVVDIIAAREHGIPVCNVPDYCTEEVADHAMALLLSLARRIPALNDAVRQDPTPWSYAAAGPIHRIPGKTLGIVGLGRIGTAVAMRAKAFGLRVAFHDPYVTDGMDRALGLTRLGLDQLLAESDFISLHTPLSPETRGMVNDEWLRKVKPGAMLVNTSRGRVLDIDALGRAMRDGRIAAAGLDVLPQEPPVPEPDLIRAWRAGEAWVQGRLIVTPHASFYSEESDIDLRVKAARTVREVLDGRPPRNRVN